jgi:hypothetical protein
MVFRVRFLFSAFRKVIEEKVNLLSILKLFIFKQHLNKVRALPKIQEL